MRDKVTPFENLNEVWPALPWLNDFYPKPLFDLTDLLVVTSAREIVDFLINQPVSQFFKVAALQNILKRQLSFAIFDMLRMIFKHLTNKIIN